MLIIYQIFVEESHIMYWPILSQQKNQDLTYSNSAMTTVIELAYAVLSFKCHCLVQCLDNDCFFDVLPPAYIAQQNWYDTQHLRATMKLAHRSNVLGSATALQCISSSYKLKLVHPREQNSSKLHRFFQKLSSTNQSLGLDLFQF
jgi:hypothetical protein